jgi:hypothetical protein
MTTKHHKNQHTATHSSSHGHDDDVSPTEARRKKRMKSMGIVAVVLMLMALFAYVMSDDESLAPGGTGETMPAIGE